MSSRKHLEEIDEHFLTFSSSLQPPALSGSVCLALYLLTLDTILKKHTGRMKSRTSGQTNIQPDREHSLNETLWKLKVEHEC